MGGTHIDITITALERLRTHPRKDGRETAHTLDQAQDAETARFGNS